MSGPVRVGVMLPNDALADDPAQLTDFAVMCEQLGFTHITALDHVLGTEHADRPVAFEPSFHDERSVLHEPLTTLAFLAAHTERLELSTGVLVLPQRQATLVAKQVAQLQWLSHGRVRLGVGSGWNYVEYEAMGMDWSNRGRRLEEQVRVLNALWGKGVVEFTGEFHRIDRGGVRPLGPKRPPIWFGGYSVKQQSRAARLADGFIWDRPSSKAYESIPTLRQLMRDQGRDPARFGFDVVLTAELNWDEEIARWGLAGGTHATVSVSAFDQESITRLRRLAGALG